MDFYDDIAERYDAITDLPQRTAAAAGFVSELVARYSVKSALDAACGTGLYAIELARLGVRAVGADISAAMVEQARKRAAAAGVSVNWIVAPMQDCARGRTRIGVPLPSLLGSVWSTHCHADVAVAPRPTSVPFASTPSFAWAIPFRTSTSRPNSNRPYAGLSSCSIPAGSSRSNCSITPACSSGRSGSSGSTGRTSAEYVRFYDFLDPFVRFNILEIDWSRPTATNRLHSTLLRPWTHEAICTALGTAGCESIESFGDIKFGPFIAEQSDTVMLIGRTETTTTR